MAVISDACKEDLRDIEDRLLTARDASDSPSRLLVMVGQLRGTVRRRRLGRIVFLDRDCAGRMKDIDDELADLTVAIRRGETGWALQSAIDQLIQHVSVDPRPIAG